MDSQKILEAAQKNKSRGAEYETKESVKSYLFGFIVTIVVNIMLFIIECINGTINLSLIILGGTMLSTTFLCEGIKTKKLGYILIGAFATVVTVIFLLAFIAQVVAK